MDEQVKDRVVIGPRIMTAKQVIRGIRVKLKEVCYECVDF